MKWYFKALKAYAVFSGRARRTEYWAFLLVNVAILAALAMLELKFEIPSTLSKVYQFAILIPSVAVGVRRMHDTGHNGLWLFMPFLNLLFAMQEGDREDNRYGKDPKTLPDY